MNKWIRGSNNYGTFEMCDFYIFIVIFALISVSLFHFNSPILLIYSLQTIALIKTKIKHLLCILLLHLNETHLVFEKKPASETYEMHKSQE